MNWEDKLSVKKGNAGEKIVRERLEKWGWIVYRPVTDAPHAFDFLCIANKKDIVIVEVKTKARRKHYEDTGFNLSSLNTYKGIKKKLKCDFYIAFIDCHEDENTFYYEEIDELLLPVKINSSVYPKEDRGIIYFHLEQFGDREKLTEEELKTLEECITNKTS